MREIVLDTETTGLDPSHGHRIVEIGCVELLNHVPTGRAYQVYVNPERAMPAEAFEVHGLSDEFLSNKPVFSGIADQFLAFLADSPLVIHNAAFDMGFINAELNKLGKPAIDSARAVDTVQLARTKFPGSPANLDALCRRFQVDISDRALHGALKDARLLADVYLELLGGRQPGLKLLSKEGQSAVARFERQRPPRVLMPSPDEQKAHDAFLGKITEPLWNAAE